MSDAASYIPLSEMIQNLRLELEVAMKASEDAHLRFLVESIDVDVQVAVRRSTEGGGGVKFWVVNADGKKSVGEEAVHTVRLKLKPVTGEKQAETFVNQTMEYRPE